MCPFKPLYGYDPPHLAFPSTTTTSVKAVEDYLKQRDSTLDILKKSLHKAQERMVHYANENRIDRSFQVGDAVYLKLQPYRQSSIALRKILKLSAKYYGPFLVIKKIGAVACKLQLPLSSRIHPVFHVSQLKKCISKTHTPSTELPVVDDAGQILLHPVAILNTRSITRHGRPVEQLLIQ
ncbi:uncharacterized protein LOC113295536 [Papaver somniferum]|uniref:uncharacterized protein LOC113295536 n=1 Tax=Papaver somniferum TaxID=3469 RepID=UPI000E6FCC0A|nr:uncharacterized protein LOC113295536 [Papaver somniferum]